jgi:hypothetical protein
MTVVQDILKKIEESINNTQLKEEFSKKGEVLEVKD